MLGHVREFFTRKNGARGGRILGEVVDLILSDYSVNDAYIDKNANEAAKLVHSNLSSASVLESVTEFAIRELLAVKSKPAVVYVETGTPSGHINASPSHTEVSKS